MPVTPYSEPSLQEFVSIKPVPTVSTQVEQGTVIVAPHYDLTDLRDSAGNLNPAAKIGDVKISSLTALWYASTGIGEYEFPVQSVDSARRVDESTMRVFGAVGTNASLFEITGEKDEVIVRSGTANFSSTGGSIILLTDSTANWGTIFSRKQIPFTTSGMSPQALPNYNKPMLVARVYDEELLIGEFLVNPYVSTSSPTQLYLWSASYANEFTYEGGSLSETLTYKLVYKPKLWSLEQAPTAAKARVVAMDRPALSDPDARARITVFRTSAGNTQSVPLSGGGTALLMNVSTSSVRVRVVVDDSGPPAATTVTVSSSGGITVLTITYAGTSTTVNALNTLIAATSANTPPVYFDAVTVGGSVIDFDSWISAEQRVPLDGAGVAPLRNNLTSTVNVVVNAATPDPAQPTAVSISGTTVTITYNGVDTTVSALNTLIQAAVVGTPPVTFGDLDSVGSELIDFGSWEGGAIAPLMSESIRLIVPVYTTHVQYSLNLEFTKPGSSLVDYADGYAVSVAGATTTVELNGKDGLIMTPPGVVSEILEAINSELDQNAPVSGGDLYFKSPFKFFLTDEFLTHASEWRILTAGLFATATDYEVFEFGDGMGTTRESQVSFSPSYFRASVDVLSTLLGSLGNRYQIQYRLVYDETSSITYENDTITIAQGIDTSTGYFAGSALTIGDLVNAVDNGPTFVDANASRLFEIGNELNNESLAENPVSGLDLNAVIYPECLVAQTDGFFSSAGVAVNLPAPSANDTDFVGGTFRARVKINPLALYSNTSTANASIYVDFRALRLDTTAVTTLSAYGRRPDLVALTRDNYVEVLGPVVPSNPAAVAAHEFYRVGGQRALWFLGVDEIDTTTEGHQYGTPAAIGRAIDLIVRRTGYNIGVLSYGSEIRNLILQKITDLGGTETLRLIKGMDFWIPLKSPDRYPDVLVESSSYVGVGGPYNYYVYTTSDFSSNEAAAAAVEAEELFLVLAGDPDASGADPESILYDLGDGKRGWKVTELIAENDPSWVEVEGNFNYPDLDEGDGLLFYRRGFGLITAAGRNMQATAEALSINESAATSMRLMKILGDTATRNINGIEYRLPHEMVMVGQTLGLLQQLGPTEPCTGLEYFGIRELTGTNDVFTTAQLDLIRGGGAFIPTQEQAGARRTRVSFDVSSDMTNSYTINRCLHVTDDLLSERIRRRIDPLRSARRVDQLLIDEITLQINTEVESVQRKYEAINLVAVVVLTDEQKVKYGIDTRRSGLYVQIYKKHPKISSDLILENIIEF